MTAEQVEAYALHVRIEEISQKLKTNDVVPANHLCRSPSPSPEYDNSGRRTNTRHRRYRERLQAERHSLIQQAARTIPNYCPPADYVFTARTAVEDKVYIPTKDFPKVNFIGQILGPRGRSLVEMNNQSGATIFLRGKGSVKEGSGRGRGRGHHAGFYHEQEPLHCLITADSQGKVDKAKALVRAVIETAATTPEHANDRKREQLRVLAVANGTFRDDEGFYGTGDKYVGIVCRICSSAGHIARDCRVRKMNAGREPKTPPWRKTGQPSGRKPEDELDVMYLDFLSGLKRETNGH
ncbi:hypothetical protein B0H67DRAFT_481493 [Lasiosphaeris hirsuta]|uniref:Branchpoint-bridging protein n=1 Tax=Lasiosphaeris hirsuta TaxID=260670 RepID=A0AA40B0K9_9PEZI|nr:hypothetical protein B0H67DRAFT_481493 [Lasiosphaeris hirsuta]